MDSLAFLGSASRKLQPIYALHGDESFLKRQALAALRARAFGADGDEFGYSAPLLLLQEPEAPHHVRARGAGAPVVG